MIKYIGTIPSLKKCVAKKILVIKMLLFFPVFLHAQYATPEYGWHLLDKVKDGILGSGMERVYEEILKGKKANSIIVAVIDGGVDTEHEDLKNMIFENRKEKAGNGKDDDRNGYIDDIHGWNFLGTSKANIYMDNQEITRQLRQAIKEDPNSEVTAGLKWDIYKQISGLKKALKQSEQKLEMLKQLTDQIGKQNPTIDDFRSYRYRNGAEEKLLMEVTRTLKSGADFKQFRDEIIAKNQKWSENIKYQLNIDYDPRTDLEFKGKYFGNPHSNALNPFHGTHVAGIIAAERNNNLGVKGIADKVRVMPLTIVPEGGTVRDEDIASAIRYAVDNGAKVINMSFGKQQISVRRELVDEAVKYAGLKDVLIVHGAGNNGWNLDHYDVYPKKQYKDGGEAESWIEVTASGNKENEYLLAPFSNYSRSKVDICAPGVDIYSTVPGNKYQALDGTSMAAPIVSGVAAMLRAYYPKLTALEVKNIILKSVTKVDPNLKVNTPEGMLVFTEICKTGGIINAYNAFLLAKQQYEK